MPPSSFHPVFQRQEGGDGAAPWAGDGLAAQWSNPADILSVLLLLGPDIVHRAIAQLTGRAVTPVAFSFGWVTYSVASLARIFGDGRLMPDADVPNTLVVGSKSGHSRFTTSWVLGRLLRDANDRVDKELHNEKAHQSSEQSRQASQPRMYSAMSPPAMGPEWEALRVTVYEFTRRPPLPHGVPTTDLIWWSGFVVILLELIIAMVPWIVDDDWAPFLVTASGNVLALIGSSLPQWRAEKWACPHTGGDTVTITEGNGSRHAVLILGRKDVGLDLEILARGTRTSKSSMFTKVTSVILAILWICHLIAVAGLGENTWFILAIGLLGGAQNLYVAGSARQPDAMGFHLDHMDTIRGNRVAAVLKEVEEKYPMSGSSLVEIFYPGSLRVKNDDDLKFWRNAMRARYAPNKYGTCVEAKSFEELNTAT